MNGYLIDSSVIIEYTKGNRTVVDLLDNIKVDLCSSYIVMAELYEGIFRSKNEVEKNIIGFMESLDKIYGLDKRTSKIFGKLRSDLKKKGQIIEDMDILIASTCLANNLTLITLNIKHFNRIKDLEILNTNDLGN